MHTVKGPAPAQDTPRPSSQHKADLFALEEKRRRNKRQRQQIEDKGEGKRNKGQE